MNYFPLLFDALARIYILIERVGFDVDSANKKLRLNDFNGVALQVTLLSESVVQAGELKGKGSLTQLQSDVCSLGCDFIVKNLGGGGGCNQTQALSLKAKKAKAWVELGRLNKLETLPKSQDVLVRCSTFGDISRLSPEYLTIIHELLSHERVTHRLAYVQDVQTLVYKTPFLSPSWQELVMASCQTKQHVASARRLGFNVYATRDAKEVLSNEARFTPLYRCPVDNKGLASFGCSRCKITCNGQREVLCNS